MAHFINLESLEVEHNVLVDTRPRVAQFSPDGSEVWVSSEIGGNISVINTQDKEITTKITFEVPGLQPEEIQPVGIKFDSAGERVYAALGPSSRVAVIDAKTYEVIKYLLVGQRVWNLDFSPDEKFVFTTNGISNDVSVIDTEKFARNQINKSRTLTLGRCSETLSTSTLTSTSIPLSIESVSFSYAKKQILDQISFSVNPGSFCVLLGANGAGKTTLFSLITRLYSPNNGRIVIFDHDLNKQTEMALGNMGVVFQNPTLDQDLTIKQNLEILCIALWHY